MQLAITQCCAPRFLAEVGGPPGEGWSDARKLPHQAHSCKSDSVTLVSLGRKLRGGGMRLSKRASRQSTRGRRTVMVPFVTHSPQQGANLFLDGTLQTCLHLLTHEHFKGPPRRA